MLRGNPLFCALVLLSMSASSVFAQQSSAPKSISTPSISTTGTGFLSFVTVPIRIYCDQSLLGTATGFFFKNLDTKKTFLITNRHVVIEEPKPGQTDGQYPDHLVLRLHTDKNDLRRSEDLSVPLYRGSGVSRQRLWRELDNKIDVVAIEIVTPDFTTRYEVTTFTRESLFPADMHLAIGDSLVIIGYPLGFSDEVFNLPIAREGTVASVYPVPFEGNRYFLVDARLHPGTSGSPVITRPASLNVRGGLLVSYESPFFYLLGVNSGSFGELNLNAVWFADIIPQLVK